MAAASVELARRNLEAAKVGDRWLDWLARLLPVITIEAVLAWLDASQPDAHGIADRIARLVHAALRDTWGCTPTDTSGRTPKVARSRCW